MGTKTQQRRRAKPAEPREQARDTTIKPLPSAVAAGIVFIAAGTVLVLEILSVRLLAPYVGLTLETTTSIIGAVLLGIAVGAAVGGHLADRVNPRYLVVILLIGGGLLSLLTVPIVRWLGHSARNAGTGRAIEVTFASLVPVAAVLSAISPTIARWQLQDLRASGRTVGRLSAWATAGALVGTFGTGFVLVPLLPVSTSILAVGIALVVAGVLLGTHTLVLRARGIVGAVLSTLALGVIGPLVGTPCDAETTYHCAIVEPVPGYEASPSRVLLLDGEENSYYDPRDPTDLGFRYTRWIAEAITPLGKPHSPLRVVFVGGGGFTIPRWLEATRPGSHASVLEVDGKLVEFDEKHLGLRLSPDLRATIGDARLSMLREPSGSADVVVGDAFAGLTVPWQLTTTQWLREVKRVLRPGGLYALNMIDLRPLKLLRAETATLLTAFKNLRMITTAGGDGLPAGDNEVILASNGPLPRELGPPAAEAHVYDRAALVRLAAGAQVLTDNYAPVDQLVTR